MSDRLDPTLDPCGCCEGDRADEPVRNVPSLPALKYRIATHARFLERMRRAISLTALTPGGLRPLQPLTARTTDDPTIALLDASAVAADILTFYQERIANEGLLRTATERRSVLELARTIGYELGPGVAASVHLAFTVDDAPGSVAESVVQKGTQVQSVPPQGKVPQIFETSNDFVARPEWNLLRPRLTRPAELAVIDKAGVRVLHLLGLAGTFPATTDGLLTGKNPNDLHRLDTTAPSAAVMDAIPVTRIYLAESASGIAKGDVLLFVGKKSSETLPLILRAADVVEQFERRPTGEQVKRIRVDLEALPTAADPEPRLRGVHRFHYLSPAFPPFAAVRLATLPFTTVTLASTVASQAWREADLHALLGIQGWRPLRVMQALNQRSPSEPLNPEAGAFSFRETLGFFGNNAPRWSSLPSEKTKGNPYVSPWDAADVTDTSPAVSRSIWTDSQNTSHPATGPHAFLERPVKGVTARTWAVFDTAHEAQAYVVEDAREASRADFGISGRSMGLTLRHPDDTPVTPSSEPTSLTFRKTTARVASRRLEFAELPIETPLEHVQQIELDRLVLQLAVGQPIAIAGERSDTPGVDAAEIAILSDVVHAGGRTTLLFKKALEYSYTRDTVTIAANVVHATHGETVTEVLGSGNASTPNQRFPLKKPPLTYLSAPTPRGVTSTLELRVNRVEWDEIPSLYLASPQAETYTVRIDDDARAEAIFGDGEHGARVPTGNANVMATYRSGIGADGEVDARTLTLLRTMPLGIRSVTNPVAAAGAESPEVLSNARRNAPLTVLTFERIVSLDDFEDFGRTFPGIGKALADRLWLDGRDLVHLTVAGATHGAPGADVLDHLIEAVGAASDQSQTFAVGVFAQRFFTVHARIVVDPRRVVAEVLDAAAARLRDAFSFDQRAFAQSVTPSEVIARIHEVDGVVGVDLESLAEYAEDAAPAAPSPGQRVAAIVARHARWNPQTRTFEAADLLLVNPVGITLEEMRP
jgi:predicted phage baseplate assembly protein